MNMLEMITELFSGRKAAPKYGVEDLEFHHAQYRKHVIDACYALRGVLTDRTHNLILKDPEGSVRPSALIGKVMYTWLDTVSGWIEREFVPKAKRFSGTCGTASTSLDSVRRRDAYTGKRNIVHAESSMKLADEHSAKMVGVLRYLLCDDSSPVRWSASMESDATQSSVTSWYISGLLIVEENVGRIRDALVKVRDFAVSNS